jgi:hypothetical protein
LAVEAVLEPGFWMATPKGKKAAGVSGLSGRGDGDAGAGSVGGGGIVRAGG